MSTKVELQHILTTRTRDLVKAQETIEQQKHQLNYVRRACTVMHNDLERKLEPFTECDETGSEAADRFELGLEVAEARTHTILAALEKGEVLDLTDSLWRESTPTENDAYRSSIEKREASHG